MKVPKTQIVRGILWTCEQPGAWVSKFGRIEEREGPRRWVFLPDAIRATAYPRLRKIAAAGLRSCAVMVQVRLVAERRGR